MARVLLGLMLLLLSVTAAAASCGDGYYNSTRASRINAIVAAMATGSVVIVGDSHWERGSTTYAQGSQSINGKPVVILGSAGATWPTLRDCIPWSAIQAKNPSSIILQASVNDANQGICCTNQGAQNVMGAAVNAYVALGSAKWPTLVSDPPPESAAGITASTVHNAARIVFYVATNSATCPGGGSCKWSDFGWSGTTPPGSLQFIDQMSLMASASCDTASVNWAGNPCYAAVNSTLDNVHFPHDGIVTMFGNLTGIP